MSQTLVTLKNLSKVGAQTVFDQIAKHLLTMKEPSVTKTGSCKYRTFDKNGNVKNKCAAGVLIADDEYQKKFDDNKKMTDTSCSSLIDNEWVPDEHSDLISDCQRLHDNQSMGAWRKGLEHIAESYGLKLKKFKDVKR